jgi:hypothetical protein
VLLVEMVQARANGGKRSAQERPILWLSADIGVTARTWCGRVISETSRLVVHLYADGVLTGPKGASGLVLTRIAAFVRSCWPECILSYGNFAGRISLCTSTKSLRWR